MAPNGDFLTSFHLRAVKIGVQTTLIAVVAAILFAILPGSSVTDPWPFTGMLVAAATGAFVVARLPWQRAFEAGKAMTFFYTWSVFNIVIVTAAISVTGGGRSHLYVFYALTTIYFGVVCPPLAQLGLLALTVIGYLTVIASTGWEISASQLVLRLTYMGTLAFLASFLARELKQNIAAHRHLALYDSLTSLPNRILVQDRLGQAIAVARRQGNKVALFVIDLDRFKEINDTLGHPKGDILLQEMGARLTEEMREMDTVARLGGDEFAVLVPDVVDTRGAEEIAERILRTVRRPFAIGDLTLDLDAGIGIAMFPDHGKDATMLLQRADVALYVTKGTHHDYQIYSSATDDYSTTRLVLLADLRRAVERGQIVIHYQPKVDTRTSEVLGVEALVRWQHPELGLLPPDVFVHLAEQTGTIRQITKHVLDEATTHAAKWRDAGHPLSVAVNLSVKDLQDPSLPDLVSECLDRCGLEPSLLELEITERMIMADPQGTISVLSRMSEAGITLALDDFGTGYSSLAHLRELPVDLIKIDKSFVMNMADNEKDAAIVRSTIDLARNLGMSVVAEGVETEKTRLQLVSLGCPFAQGYLFSRPVPPSQIDSMLVPTLRSVEQVS